MNAITNNEMLEIRNFPPSISYSHHAHGNIFIALIHINFLHIILYLPWGDCLF